MNHPNQTQVVPMFVRAYLRASTDEQDATRARDELVAFAAEHHQKIAAFYVENVSGAKLERSGLSRLLADSHAGDVLLIEDVDRLSRLDEAEWEELKARINAHGMRIVCVNLPTSHMMMDVPKPDDFTARMFAAINAMMIDVTAAVARKDYLDRRRRQLQGQAGRRRRPLQGPPGGHPTQRPDRRHARQGHELERCSGGYRVQPGYGGQGGGASSGRRGLIEVVTRTT